MRDTADGSKGPSLRVMMEKVSKTTAERPEGGHTISSEVERAVEFRALEAMLAPGRQPRSQPARPAPSPATTSKTSSTNGPPPHHPPTPPKPSTAPP